MIDGNRIPALLGVFFLFDDSCFSFWWLFLIKRFGLLSSYTCTCCCCCCSVVGSSLCCWLRKKVRKVVK